MDFDVADYLGDLLQGKVSELQRLTGGDWSQAFAFHSEGRELVARFGRHVDDFEKDRAAVQFSSYDLPVPEVLTITKAPGGFCCVSERKFGSPLEDADAEQLQALVPAVLRMWDALRTADVTQWIESVGVPTVSWTEQLLSVDEENDRVCGWHDRMAAFPSELAVYRQNLRRLDTLVRECPQDLYLQHNDLLHANVLVSEGRISAVLDWGCAGLGDFLYDLAIFDFYRPWFPAMAAIDWVREAEGHFDRLSVEVPNFAERLDCYRTHVGLAGMAYCAFIDDPVELRRHAVRLAGLQEALSTRPSRGR